MNFLDTRFSLLPLSIITWQKFPLKVQFKRRVSFGMGFSFRCQENLLKDTKVVTIGCLKFLPHPQGQIWCPNVPHSFHGLEGLFEVPSSSTRSYLVSKRKWAGILHSFTIDFKWAGIVKCLEWGVSRGLVSNFSLCWNKSLRSVSKGSFKEWSSNPFSFLNWSLTLLTLKRESKSESHYFLDGRLGVCQGEPLKTLTFEEGKEKTEYLKYGWQDLWGTDRVEREGTCWV